MRHFASKPSGSGTRADDNVSELITAWDREIGDVAGTVSIELRSLSGLVASRLAQTPHYAASTLKVAVLVAALAEQSIGRLDFREELRIHDEFASAAGGRFRLDQSGDQDDVTWRLCTLRCPVNVLVKRMVVDSSNIATNVLIERIGLEPVRRVLVAACANAITMNRLIGDLRAEAAGITNLVTTRGLAELMSSLTKGRLVPHAASLRALELLAQQNHRTMIPAGLPTGTWSASKGGWTSSVRHDVALIRPEAAPPYVLAVCTTTELKQAAEALIARLSTVTWEHWTRCHA